MSIWTQNIIFKEEMIDKKSEIGRNRIKDNVWLSKYDI